MPQICAVCLLPLKPDDPVTAFHAVGYDILVHTRCEDVLMRCAACGGIFGTPGGRLVGRDPSNGRLRAYHVGHQPREEEDHAS